MLIYARHGKTSHNAGGSEEKLRGWLPLPLTPEGRAQAKAAGKRLKGLQPTTFTSSDLPRAMETAGIVGNELGVQPTPDPAIRDWNTGEMAGHKVSDVKDYLFHYIDHPDEVVPGGESLNSYLDRFVPAMRARINDSGVHLVVGHARGATILQGIASPVGGKGQGIDPKYLKQRPDVGPGEVLAVPPSWNLTHLKG